MKRHRLGLSETATFVGIIFVLGAVAFEYEFSDSISNDKKIDFQEAIALGVVYVACTIYFGWRRMTAQEYEIKRRVAAESRAHELANTDILTGLANRRQFEHALMETIAAPPGAGKVHAVLAIDLNKFKRVNDVYGHPAGDDVLITVSQRLAAIMRDGDLLARLGGDEFAVIARHLASAESATGIANRILKTLEEPIEAGSVQHHVGAGIGLALMPDDGTSAEEIMRKADIALYRAKAGKKSEAHFFELEMDRQSREREALERDLTTAIENGAVAPWYQPIVDLPTQKVIAFEALARWTHPTLGEIPPDRFIPIAEDCGLINRLSDYLLRRACTDAMAWPDDVLLSFNISPAQLKEKTLGLSILGILGETGLPPHRLEIEITESAVVRDLDTAKIVLGALREAGVRVALDDFGTGYSSLYHLRNFKFDAIKIDRSFVGDMALASESAAIVRALTGLGHGLGLTITAEGIEQSSQRDALLSQGCERGQGFLFSRAVPAAQTQALLAHSQPAETGHAAKTA